MEEKWGKIHRQSGAKIGVLARKEVKEKVAEISQEVVRQVKRILEQIPDQKLRVNPQIDLYNPKQEEILLFEDGTLVKGQKAERESRTQLHKSRKKATAEDP